MTVDPRAEPNREPDTRQLSTYGWVPWAEAARLLHAAEGVWLAPLGVVRRSHDPWPAEMPLTTRIHAWDGASSVQWRLVPRPARSTVLLTCLSEVGVRPASAVLSRLVAVTCECAGEWERTWVFDAAASMFIRPAPPAPRRER